MSQEVSTDDLMNDLDTNNDSKTNESPQPQEEQKQEQKDQVEASGNQSSIDKTQEGSQQKEEEEEKQNEEQEQKELEKEEKPNDIKQTPESKPEYKPESKPEPANKQAEKAQNKEEEEEEEEEEETGKGQGLPSFSPDKQKPLGQLKGRDIFLWRNVYASSVVFVALQALYILLVVYEMSVLSLLTRLVLFNIAIAVAYYVIRRIFTNAPASGSSNTPSVDKFVIDADAVEPYVEQILDILNRGIHSYISIVKCEDFAKTMKFGGIVWAMSILSNLMSGLSLFYLGVWISFTAPRIYEWKKQPIDQVLNMAQEQIVKYGKIVYDKIPKASAAKQTKTE